MNTRTRFLFAVLALAALALLFAFDASAAVMMAATFAATEEDMAEIATRFKKARDDFEKSRDDLEARVHAIEQRAERGPMDSPRGAGRIATLSKNLSEDPAFKHIAAKNVGSARAALPVELKAILNEGNTISSGDGSMPSNPEYAGLFGPAMRPLRLLDALPTRPVSAESVEFVQLGATGDAAEQEGEGAEKAEVEFDGTKVTANIVTIAAHTTGSQQVLLDHTALQQKVDQVLRHKAVSRLENQLINGDGTSNRISGLRNQATVYLPAIGTTPADIIGEALADLADSGYQPNLVIMNTMDWFRIQVTKTATEQEYQFGSPTKPAPPSLWNTPIVLTPSMPTDKALIIDTTFVTVLDRMQTAVMASTSHKDYFTRNLVLILAELRAGLEVTDTQAVYEVDLGTASSGA